MPFYGRWDDMPRDLDDLQERIVEAHEVGYEQGRGLGEGELAEAVLEYLKKEYYGRDVVRQSDEANAILTVVKGLSSKIKRGGELRKYDVQPRKRPSRPIEMIEHRERMDAYNTRKAQRKGDSE